MYIELRMRDTYVHPYVDPGYDEGSGTRELSAFHTFKREQRRIRARKGGQPVFKAT